MVEEEVDKEVEEEKLFCGNISVEHASAFNLFLLEKNPKEPR